VTKTASKISPFVSIVGGGLLAGLLDGADAIIYYGLMYGVSAKQISIHIASGLIGRHAAVQGGELSIVLGLFLHFLIAFSAATIFYLVAGKWPSILSHPLLSGTVFGLLWYMLMYRIVLPLSAIPRNPNPRFSLPDFADEIFAHIFLVGIPIALMATYSLHVKRPGFATESQVSDSM